MMIHTKAPAKYSDKSPILAPEEVTIDGWYSFNLNPAEQHSYDDPLKRWNECYKDIQQLITEMNSCAEIEGYLEISRTGRVHMHGYIRYKDITEFYLRLPKMLSKCTVSIDTIEDMDVWQNYCTKQQLSPQYKKDIAQDKAGTTIQQVKRSFIGDLDYGLKEEDKPQPFGQFFTVTEKRKPKKKRA